MQSATILTSSFVLLIYLFMVSVKFKCSDGGRNITNKITEQDHCFPFNHDCLSLAALTSIRKKSRQTMICRKLETL